MSKSADGKRLPQSQQDGGADFVFQVLNSATPFEVINLRQRTWKEHREDYNYYSLQFSKPVTRPICVLIWTKDELGPVGRKRRRVVNRFFVEPREPEYALETHGKNRFWVADTHEVHVSGPQEEGVGWDRVSFGIVNRQIAWVREEEEAYPQWLLTAGFDELFERATGGLMHGLPYTPLDPMYYDPSVRDPEDVPQKTPLWHILRKGKIGSSTAYKIGMGCFTAKSRAGPVRSNRLMRMGSILEDALAMAFVQHTGMEYWERGWRDHPLHPGKWGDSVDGLLRDPTMCKEKVPGLVQRMWIRQGVDIDAIDLTLGVFEIKCSDKDIEASNQNYYMGQTTWHMTAFPDRWWGIILRGSPAGKNSRVQCYYWWRDLDFERIIIKNVTEGQQFKDDIDAMDKWGRRQDIAELRLKMRKRAYAMTKGRERPGEMAFTIEWPTEAVREYMNVIPKANEKAATRSPGFPDVSVPPVLKLERNGWMHEFPIVYKQDREELGDILDAWPGRKGPSPTGIYTRAQYEKRKSKGLQVQQTLSARMLTPTRKKKSAAPKKTGWTKVTKKHKDDDFLADLRKGKPAKQPIASRKKRKREPPPPALLDLSSSSELESQDEVVTRSSANPPPRKKRSLPQSLVHAQRDFNRLVALFDSNNEVTPELLNSHVGQCLKSIGSLLTTKK